MAPGIHLWDLGEAATANNMSLPVGALPVFGGITLGGAIAASAHGSGDGEGVPNTPIDMVQEIVWVDAKGEKHVATKESQEWEGMYAGLGLVGVMTELVVQLRPLSHTKFETEFRKKDDNMVEEIDQLLKQVGGKGGEGGQGG